MKHSLADAHPVPLPGRLPLQNSLAILLLTVLGVIAVFVRFNGFNTFGFNAADEYYIIKSVRNILERGLPEYAAGGYYIRGILYQYLCAGLILLGINEVTALRIIPLICNILSVPVVYLIAQKIINKKFAFFAAFLFAFSVWEIEIARFARFYAPFQLIFLLYIYFLLEILVDKKTEKYKWLHLLTFIALFLHEEAIFLVALNFLPNFLEKNKVKLLPTILLFLLGVFLTMFDFRNAGVTDHLPQDIKLSTGSDFPLYKPHFLFPLIFSKPLWLAAFLLPLAGFFYYIIPFFKKKEISPEIKLYFLLFGTGILFNLFGLVLFILVILLFAGRINSINFGKRDIVRFSLFLSISFIFYFAFSYTDRSWIAWFNLKSFSITKSMLLLFNYPDIYEKFFIAWFEPFPMLTVILLLSLSLIVFLFLTNLLDIRKAELSSYIKTLMLTVLVLSFFVTIIVTPFKNLRYWFFIYPLLLILISFFIYYMQVKFKSAVIRNIIAFGFLLLIFVVSEDHNINHIKNIDTLEASFRINYPVRLAGTYYYKEDYESAAEKIVSEMKEDDLIVSTVAPIEHYLPRLDYYYRTFNDPEFSGRSRNRGTTEVWTNARLIYKEEEFLNLLKNEEKNIWLVTYSPIRPGVPSFDKKLVKVYKDDLYFTNRDGTLFLFYLKAKN